ncbi:uncharacterized protein LOC113227733 [Hyposmocoma kahamanoa]|uniref:uncharacterized protein LOC113227733 n=1 Tax=Hyposmocoma kahamanoa TaxID=1477025 RepID=UPI000E6D8804|nr:uncharacterized protein LOC113227733 [Hyposmocoma kahamanoa]
MPRTKRPVKKTEKASESGEASEFLKKLSKTAEEQKKRIDERVQMEVRNLELAFKILVGSISKEHLNMTVGQLKNELYLKEVTNTRRSRNLTRSASDDEPQKKKEHWNCIKLCFVRSMQPDELANCNIMLCDGTMLSLQPRPLRQSQAFIPFSLMETTVLTQLKTLKDNLDKVVQLGEKALK